MRHVLDRKNESDTVKQRDLQGDILLAQLDQGVRGVDNDSCHARHFPCRRTMPSVTAIIVDTSNALVELREQDIALQITRLAWELLSSEILSLCWS
jgi:hypothetical protein